MISGKYLKALAKWAPFAMKDIYGSGSARGLRLLRYGPGYDAWGVQTNQKAFSALAVLATDSSPLVESLSGISREELLDVSLALLRFSLESHIEGSSSCTDGRKWGHTWISVLGIERMMHAVEDIAPFIPEGDKELLKKVLLSEVDWLMDKYEVVGALDATTGRNHPESNLWNGALLHRVAALFPDASRAAEYKGKGSSFLINSISIPSDSENMEIVDGKTVKGRFLGANFFEGMSLDHHAYLNVGYMSICVSNAAMLHFSFKRAGLKTPEALYHNLEKLWGFLRKLTFPDGRHWRIGGDTRARYCYCQDYMIPNWILAASLFSDAEAVRQEASWMEKVEREVESNADGSFLSSRCATLRRKSPLYYTRLESDRAASISMGLSWRRSFKLPEAESGAASEPISLSWSEPFHGAVADRNPVRCASWACRAAEGPCATFVPTDASDMAEWRFNLIGLSRGLGRKSHNEVIAHSESSFDGGFTICAKFVSKSAEFLAEGEQEESLALHHAAFAVLPDSHSAIVLQRAVALMPSRFSEVKGLNWLLPNDIFNRFERMISLDGARAMPLRFDMDSEPVLMTALKSIDFDGRLGAELVYGKGPLCAFSPNSRRIGLRDKPDAGGMLHAVEVCAPFFDDGADYEKDDVLFDCGFALWLTAKGEGRHVLESRALHCGVDAPSCRAVSVRGADGVRYLFAANFGDSAERLRIEGVECFELQASESKLLKL